MDPRILCFLTLYKYREPHFCVYKRTTRLGVVSVYIQGGTVEYRIYLSSVKFNDVQKKGKQIKNSFQINLTERSTEMFAV